MANTSISMATVADDLVLAHAITRDVKLLIGLELSSPARSFISELARGIRMLDYQLYDDRKDYPLSSEQLLSSLDISFPEIPPIAKLQSGNASERRAALLRLAAFTDLLTHLRIYSSSDLLGRLAKRRADEGGQAVERADEDTDTNPDANVGDNADECDKGVEGNEGDASREGDAIGECDQDNDNNEEWCCEHLGDREDLSSPVSTTNEDEELTSAITTAVRVNAEKITHLALVKRVLRFLRRRVVHCYDTPAAVAATRAALVPLLYSPVRTDAALAAIALCGLQAAAPRRYRARLARALTPALLPALLTAPLTNPLMIESLARAVRYAFLYSPYAGLAAWTANSPVPIELPSEYDDESNNNKGVVGNDNDDGGDCGADEINGKCQSDSIKTNATESGTRTAETRTEKTEVRLCDDSVELLPTSFDGCIEMQLLRLFERALRTLSCKDNVYTNMLSALALLAQKVTIVSEKTSISPLQLYQVFLAETGYVTRHYATARICAHTLAAAPIVALAYTAMIGDPTLQATAFAAAAAAADVTEKGKRQKHNDTLAAPSADLLRLAAAARMSKEVCMIIFNNMLDIGLALPCEKPRSSDALLPQNAFDAALWERHPSAVAAWKAAADRAIVAVRDESVLSAVAAKVAAAAQTAEENIRAFAAAVAAHRREKRYTWDPKYELKAEADMPRMPFVWLMAEVFSASAFAVLPLVPYIPPAFFSRTCFYGWKKLA